MSSLPRRRALALALSLPPALAACTAGGGSDGTADGGTSDGGVSDGSASDGGGASDGAATAEPTTPAPPSAAELLLEDLSEDDLAAQLVMVGVRTGTSIDPELLEEHPVGGFFLLGVWESADAVDEVVDAALDGGREDLPPLLAVDQEGGQVRMLRGSAARRTSSAARLGEEGAEAVTETYTSIGEDLAARRIPLALSPVADVVDPELGEDNGPVGALDRGFGTDAEQVGACVRAAVEALDAQGVGASLKHFPGLGRVRENTDFSAEGIEDTTTSAEDPFLDSFAEGIAAGADAVMLASAVYPRIDPDNAAMFSSAVVTDLLRGSLGFDGLVVTDDIGAAKAVADVPVAERATRLLAAGGDVVLTADPSIAAELAEAIAAWAQESPEQAARVRESAGRMLALKEKRGLLGS
ncbi:glycoside hydrolase family 3 N-terminal domain-containing protein [Brachybacterium squillarum]|uniref:glycoside hydrolase family 3 N-terminal domain-containing protein n=1 Tax=Brachybacterium squillarum TaxID=661979 RepID=UPI0022225FDD|nr:glycoside hydrolase family 3 N-terminal domain-containing protein [Brachybacterium squillarum]MCW1804713.1 glycoside hydrolase family 3 protein [Brachybacterium squillarum]